MAKAQLVQASIERGQGPVFMKSFEGDRLSASGQIDQLPSLFDERSSEIRTIRAVSHLQSCGDLAVWRSGNQVEDRHDSCDSRRWALLVKLMKND